MIRVAWDRRCGRYCPVRDRSGGPFRGSASSCLPAVPFRFNAPAHDRVDASSRASVGKPYGGPASDLLIAATAKVNDLPPAARNTNDFDHLDVASTQVKPVKTDGPLQPP
jgi:hypothetical protein